jgi:hypothetical protein
MSEVLTGALRATTAAVMPAKAGIQYAVKMQFIRDVSEDWITRLRG